MAKRSGAARSNRIDFAAYFSPATQVPEPPLKEADRKRYDDLGVIGEQELSAKGYYAGIVRGTRGARAKPAAQSKGAAETTVLVVEDDTGTVEVIERVLEAAGYNTRAAHNRAQIAEELGRQPRPDVILLDVVLAPGLSGFNVLNKLQQHESLRRIPVIMLTSMSAGADVVKGLSLGASAYLTKPARPSALVEAVKAVLA